MLELFGVKARVEADVAAVIMNSGRAREGIGWITLRMSGPAAGPT